MLEILACIKGVAALLQQADIWLSGYICQAVHLQMQSFLQLALIHLDPQNKVIDQLCVFGTQQGFDRQHTGEVPEPTAGQVC